MDVETLRQHIHQHAFRIELPTEQYIFSILLSGYKILPDFRHYHAAYEIKLRYDENDLQAPAVFEIIPPHTWHQRTHRTAEYPTLVSFLCYVSDRPGQENERLYFSNSVLHAFLQLDQPVEFPDTFEGRNLVQKILNEAETPSGSMERIYARMQLLMTELAYVLPVERPDKQNDAKYNMVKYYPESIEAFLGIKYCDPDCSREQLAELLYISSRQLGRILQQLYGKSFRDLLTEYRMETAHVLQKQHYSSAETAKAVGYRSESGFLHAWEQYYGYAYGKIGKDMF